MKTRSTPTITRLLILIPSGLCLALLFLAYHAGAAVQWWDNNGTSVPTSGTWDTTTANWSSTSNLTASTAVYTSGNYAAFVAGSNNPISSLTITVPGPITCAGISNENSYVGSPVVNLTISGPGPITIPSGQDSFFCGPSNTETVTISTPLAGAGTIVQHGNGQLSLYGVNTYTGGTTLTGGQIINYNNSASFGTSTITVSGSSGAIVNNSGGALVLANPLSFSAANFNLNIVGGAAVAGIPGTTITGTVNLGPSGTTILYTGGSGSPSVDLISGVISGAAGLTTEDYGNLELSATNTYTGNTAISTALGTPTLTIAGAGLLGGATGNYAGAVANTGTFVYSSSATQTLSGVISGSGTFTVNGTGKLTLTGANTFTGPLNVSSGTVVVGASSPIGGSATVSGGSLTTSGNIAGNVTVSGGSLATSGNISGNVAVSGGALATAGVIAGNNVTISGGTVDVQSAGSLFANNITITGGNLELDNPTAISNQLASVFLPSGSSNNMFLNFAGTDYILALNIGGTSLATGTWGAAGSGATHTNAAFTGTGILAVAVSSGTNYYWDANGSDAADAHNIYGGGNGNWNNVISDWWVSGGADTAWVSAYAANFGGTAGTVTVADNVTPGSLIFTTPGYVLTNSGNFSIFVTNPAALISVPAGTTTIAAPITGQGLVVNGPGTLVLSGTNTYTAGTVLSNNVTVSANAIADSGTSGISTGPVTFDNGTLNYTGTTAATTARHFLGIPSTTNAINVPSGVNLTLNSQINGNSPGWLVNKTGTGTLTLGGTGDNSWLGMNVMAGEVILNKTVTGAGLGGPVNVNSGATLQLSGSGYGKEIFNGTTTPVAINSGGLFDMNGQSNTLNTLSLGGTGIGGSGVVINSAAGTSSALNTPITLTANTTIGGISSSPGNIALLGVISGNPSLTQAGTGLLTLGGTSTFFGGLNINPNTAVMLVSNQAAGLGPITIGANGTLMLDIPVNNSSLLNPIIGGPTASINVLPVINTNTGINGNLLSFTGQLNCPASASTAKVQFTVSESFQINPAAIINVSNGGTLYVANHNVVVPCTVNMFGTGNSEVYGALRLESGALISGPVNLYGNTTMGNNVSGAAGVGTISGVISSVGGSYGITFQPVSGTIQLTGANTYSGITTLNGSIVQLDSAENAGTSGPLGNPATPAGSIVMSGGQLQFTPVNNHDYSSRFSTVGGQKFYFDVSGQTVTLATPLASSVGGFGLQSTVAGGSLVMSAANTYTSNSIIASGTLVLNAAETPGSSGPLGSAPAVITPLGSIPGTILMTGGKLQFTSVNNNDYSGRFATNSGQSFNLDVNGQNVSFANSLISSNGSLTVSSTTAGGSLTLNNTNYLNSGAIAINPGATLAISGTGRFSNTNGLGIYSAAISDMGTFNFGSSANQLLMGAITGNGSLIKSGTGTLTLSNLANAYFGGTTVSNGTLNITNNSAIAGNVTVAGGVLLLGNSTALNANAVLTLPGLPATGMVNLNFSGVQTVSALEFGTTNMASGTYGAVGSSATYQYAAFTGSGILNVAGQVAFWDPGSLVAGPGSGGNGSWDFITSDWWVSGNTDSVWAGTNTAFFAGTNGTASVNANVSASGLSFAVSNYVVSGGSTLTLLSATNTGTPMIAIPNGNTIISCPIASATTSNSIVVSGPGTLTLSADNSAGLTNSLEVTDGGTLSVNSIEDLGNGASAVGNGANLMLFDGNLAFTGTSGQSSRHITLSGPISNTISVLSGNTLELDGQVQNIGGTAPQVLAFTGGGTLIFGGTIDNASLDVAILAGTLQLNKGNLGSGHGIGGGTSIVGSGATLQLAGSGFQLYSGTVLTVASGGVFDLNGQFQYGTGALSLLGTGIGGVGALINSSGSPSFLTNSSITLTGDTTIGGSGNITLAGVISGIGPSLTYSGTSGAQLFLSSANTWSGGLNIAPGSTVALNSLTGAGTGPITLESGGGGGPGSGGTLILPTSGNGYGSSYFNAVNGDSTTTINITSAGTANLDIYYNLTNFQGTINCGNGGSSNPQILLLGVNNEAFPISPNATWNIANGTTLDFQAPCTVNPAKVIVNGIGNNIYGSLRMDACNQTGPVLLNGSNCQIGDGNTPAGASVISGVISDGGNNYGFTRVGSPLTTIILTAVNTYTGPTVISNGVLAIAGSGSIAASSSLTLMGGTTLDVSGVSGGSYSLNSLGNNQGLTCLGTATIGGSLTLSSGASLALQCTNIGNGLIVTNGTLTLNNNPITVTVYNSLGAQISPVPGNYPLVTTVASITGTGQGFVGGSVSSSSLTVANLNPAFNASLAISNNTLYMIIGVSAPTIVGQLPVSAGGPATMLYAGANPNFSVQAVGLPPLQYLWYTNNVLVGYATNASITLTNVQVGPLLTYCIVSNSPSYTPAQSLTWTANVTNDPTAPFPAMVLADNPLGYWRLNETQPVSGANGAIAEDYFGNNDGIYTNITLENPGYTTNNVPDSDPTETSAQFGAFTFSDSDAYAIPNINFASPAGTSPTFSIEAWVTGYPQTSDAGIVSLGYGGGGEEFNLDTGSDGYSGHNHSFRFFVRDASGATHASTSAITPEPGVWHHLVGVCDESNGVVTLYVDGLVATSGSGSIAPRSGILSSARNMIIGSRPSNSTVNNNDQFVGYINDVAVYKYALSATQVVAHYVSVGVPPSFAQIPPATVNANAGQNLILPATALGTPPLLYVWSDVGGGTNLSSGLTNGNVIGASQTISNIPSSWNGDTLSLTVSNAYGQTNITVSLNVAAYLLASLSPNANISLTAGEAYTYTVAASGSVPITYQWSSNGVPVTGATLDTFSALAPLGNTTYSCLVSNQSGTTNLSVSLTGLPYLTFDWNGAGWMGNQSGSYASTPFNNGALILTDGGGSEARSAFFATQQYIGAFEASFTYQAGGSLVADGATFCIQNDPRGASAVGGTGGGLGVTGITPSAELELNLYNGGTEIRGYSFMTNGLTGASGANGNYTPLGSVNLNAGNPVNFDLYYSQGVLSIMATDTVAATSFSTNLNVGDLTVIAGGSLAYVGFTGADGGSTSVQTISNFSFLSLMDLAAQSSGTNLVLAWPNGVSLYQVQSTTDLGSPNWMNVTNPVVTVGNMNQVTVPATGVQEFYRLQLQ